MLEKRELIEERSSLRKESRWREKSLQAALERSRRWVAFAMKSPCEGEIATNEEFHRQQMSESIYDMREQKECLHCVGAVCREGLGFLFSFVFFLS